MKLKITIFLLFLSIFIPLMAIKAVDTNNLRGKILLQVESKGEAWYVNPNDGQRYYMADGDSAFNIMKNLSLGMSNKDVDRMKNDSEYRKKFIGKILLQVESRGEAYYISSDGRYNYLKDGSAAYDIMTKKGLGISNVNLNKIAVSEIKPKIQTQTANLNSSTGVTTATDINKITPNKIKKETETETKTPNLATTTVIKEDLPTEPNKDSSILIQDQPQEKPEITSPTPTPTTTASSSTAITTIITVPTLNTAWTTTHEPMGEFRLTNKSACTYNENFKCFSDSLCSYTKDKDVKGWCLLLLYYSFGYQKKCSLLNSEYPNIDCVMTDTLPANASRDTKTLYDVKKIQILLESHKNTNLYSHSYPQNPYNTVRLFSIERFPVATKGVSSICSENYNYTYTFLDSENYTLSYCLDNTVGNLKAGINVATPQSLRDLR